MREAKTDDTTRYDDEETDLYSKWYITSHHIGSLDWFKWEGGMMMLMSILEFVAAWLWLWLCELWLGLELDLKVSYACCRRVSAAT